MVNEDGLDEKDSQNSRCWVDSRHDGDPICKLCALDIYGGLPKKKFRHPRRCWNCDENSGLDTFADIVDDRSGPTFEDL
jgi:hypothetical protein